ncbi:MAG TPA: hypothetical protein VGO84_09350 [Burkholderiales bacterium]|jgi:hypothetical protein|nr:hypothetical protein [Burkholderiales bacterium]
MTSRHIALISASTALAVAAGAALAQSAAPPVHDYPTAGRVEYVTLCIQAHGNDFVNLYKCSCVIDKIAAVLPYDEFVEQSTFSKYATLGGEGGAEFRVDQAKDKTKKFRALQASASNECGLAGKGPYS